LTSYRHILIDRDGAVATVTLNRPEVHNAFNDEMIAELTDCARALAASRTTRVVVLQGAGRSFCAGADLEWMRASLAWGEAENLADAERLAAMFEALDSLPQPLLGRVHGVALGGGVGLVACCDLACATDTAQFSFSEVKLGLAPAVIARYVVAKIGVSQARALFVAGERFGAYRAFDIGLIHGTVPAEELDDTVQSLAQKLLRNGSSAMAAAKRLVREAATLPAEEAQRRAVATIAGLQVSPEGQEGLRAFLEKRKPSWTGPDA
jgi:methylglutaconyl-CoA hydratase